MKNMNYEHVDIYSPKGLMKNLTPKTTTAASSINQKTKEETIQRSGVTQNSQTCYQPERPPSADAQNQENLSMSLSKIFFNSPRYNGKVSEGNTIPTNGPTNTNGPVNQVERKTPNSKQGHGSSTHSNNPNSQVAVSTDFSNINLLKPTNREMSQQSISAQSNIFSINKADLASKENKVLQTHENEPEVRNSVGGALSAQIQNSVVGSSLNSKQMNSHISNSKLQAQIQQIHQQNEELASQAAIGPGANNINSTVFAQNSIVQTQNINLKDNGSSSNLISPQNRPTSCQDIEGSQIRSEGSLETNPYDISSRRNVQSSTKNISKIASGQSSVDAKFFRDKKGNGSDAPNNESIQQRKTVFSSSSNFAKRPQSSQMENNGTQKQTISSSSLFLNGNQKASQAELQLHAQQQNAHQQQSRDVVQGQQGTFNESSPQSPVFFNDKNERKSSQSKLENNISYDSATSGSKQNLLQNQKAVSSKDDYHQYQQLQEKLSYLENQIMSIKTNIDSTYKQDKDKDESQTNSSLVTRFSQKDDSVSSTMRGSHNPGSMNPADTQHVVSNRTKEIEETRNIRNSANGTPSNQSAVSNSHGDQNNSKSSPLSSLVTQVKLGGPGVATTTVNSPTVNNGIGFVGSQAAQKLVKQSPPQPPTQQQNSVLKESGRKSSKPLIQEKSTPQQINLNRGPQTTTNSGNNGQIFNFSKNTEETTSQESYFNSQRSPVNPNVHNINGNVNQSNIMGKYLFYISPVIKGFIDPSDTSYFANLAREHLLQTMQAMSFTRAIKPPTQKMIDEKRVFLNKQEFYKDKKTLVFDLDQTLIHCNQSAAVPSDVILPIQFPTGQVIEAGINIRPYCMNCLQELSKLYQIVVFTASHSCYANVVLDYLDPNGQYIQHRLFRENCVSTDEGVYIKDLRVIANRNMSDLIIVDNAAYSFGFQVDNGIPILPYYDNKSDVELKHLIHYMKVINNSRDIRDPNKNYLKMNMFGDFQDPIELLQTLFEEYI